MARLADINSVEIGHYSTDVLLNRRYDTMYKRLDIQNRINYFAAEMAENDLSIWFEAKFALGSTGLLQDKLSMIVADNVTGSKAYFGSWAMSTSSLAGAREAEFARKHQRMLESIRRTALNVHSNYVNDPDWDFLNNEDVLEFGPAPTKITVWSERTLEHHDMYALPNRFGGGAVGWVSDEDVLDEEKHVYFSEELMALYDFYTVGFDV